MTKRSSATVAEAVTFRRSGMRISALLNERFGPINTLIREQQAGADSLLAERFGPIATLVRERPVKVRPAKRPEPAVQLSPAGSGLQPPKGSDDGPACAGRAPLWDFDAGEDANNCAKVICITCPVRERCLALAVRDKLFGVWGGILLDDGKPHAVRRLTNMSAHRHRANGEPLCGVCLDAEEARLARRREQDAGRRRAKKSGVA